MTDNEKELIQIIRSAPDKEYALSIAVEIILRLKEQHESSQEQVSASQEADF